MSQSIFNGQSVQLPIQIGEKLTVVAVSGTYSIVVVDGVGDGTSLATDATGGTYGPYAYSSVVRVTSSALSEIDYDVGVTTSIVSDTVVKANTDALTGGIELAAGGNKALKAILTQQKLMKTPLSASVLGNSFSNQNPNWFVQACGFSGGLLRMNTIGGVFGNTTAAMLARVASIPASSDVCFVLEGTNDVSNTVTTKVHISNIKAICSALINQGTLPIVILAPPFNSNGANMAKMRLAEYRLACVMGIPCYDIFGTYFDATTGDWTGSATVDGTHPTDTAYRDAGKSLIAQMSAQQTQSLVAPKSSVWGDLLTNNLFMASSSGSATGWSKWANGALTVTDATADGFLGQYQNIAAAGLTTGQMAGIYKAVTLPAGSSPTDVYIFQFGIKHVQVSNAQVFAYLSWKDSVNATLREDYVIYANASTAGIAARTVQMELNPPAGAVSATIFFHQTASATYSGTLSIAQPLFVNLTDLAGL